ncbi:hypothetical protein Taro_000071, partial [Colocasia esculenta]|nr:hypothetical protein [Colocasia esculenta]
WSKEKSLTSWNKLLLFVLIQWLGDVAAGDSGDSYLDIQEDTPMAEDDIDLDIGIDLTFNQETEPFENNVTKAPTPTGVQNNVATPPLMNMLSEKNMPSQNSNRRRKRAPDTCSDSLEKIVRLGEERFRHYRATKEGCTTYFTSIGHLMNIVGTIERMDFNATSNVDLIKFLMHEEDYWEECIMCSSIFHAEEPKNRQMVGMWMAQDPHSGCGFFKWKESEEKNVVPNGEDRQRLTVEKVNNFLEKEMYAAESNVALCQRLLSSFENLAIRRK